MSPSAPAPRVAIVILQWRRADETAACLRSVAALDYANYTVLVVDNHSADGSVDRLRREFPTLRTVENPANLGFAGGCNVGIEFRDPDGYAVELTCEMDQIGWDGVSRPSEQYRPAKSLEEAVANPVPR